MWGKFHRERCEWNQGIERFRKSVDYVQNENAPDYLAMAEEEFGTLYQKKGDLEKAKELLESALAWYKQKEDTIHIERIEGQLKEIG
jgi:tetratricopeptide (TPR) repeat protein